MEEITTHKLHIVPDLICIGVCIIATVTDQRTRRIPNQLTFPAFGIGLGINLLIHWLEKDMMAGLLVGLVPALTGAGFLFFLFLLLYTISAVGMGDVKLMGAIGGFVKWPLVLHVAAAVLIFGGITALVLALKQNRLKKVSSNILKIIKYPMTSQKPPSDQSHQMPYALPILLGTLVVVTWRHISPFLGQ